MKKVITFVLSLLLSMQVYSQTIYIAEIQFFDNEGKKNISLTKVNDLLKDELSEKWFDNCVDFKTVYNNQTGNIQSSFDAIKACNLIKADFLMYGYIQNNENNYICELKLYDRESKKVQKTFFASDDTENFDRMIKDVSNKIADYFITTLNINVEGKKENQLHPFELAMPASLYYWSPLDEDWSKVLIGVAGLEVGLDLFPEFSVLIYKNKSLDFNFRFNFGYKYGLGNPNYYRLNYNSISFSAPVLCNVHYNDLNSISFGIGPLYEFNILNFEKKYESFDNYIQNQFALEFIFAYQYKIKTDLLLDFELNADVYLLENAFVLLKPKFGLIWSFYRRSR